jgi:cytoskeletal protein RodZ
VNVSTGDNTVGEILRKAREAKKLSVEQVHRETKISAEVIESLEQDDFSSFASETYLKGFLRNYASFLGLEPDPLWAMMSRKTSAAETGEAAYWDTEESVHEERLKSSHIFRRFVLPAMIVVIVVLSILLIREHRKVEALRSTVGLHSATDEVMTVGVDL